MGLITLSELAGLGQVDTECGPAPGLGPGEKSMCCPEIGWVIYDQRESAYALCERAMAQTSGGDDSASIPSGASAREAEMAARRRALEARRIELEERQFQRQVQTAMMQGQIKRAMAARAASPEGQAARRASAAAAAASRARAEKARRAEQTKKVVTYGAIALAAAKLFAFF